MKPKSLIISGDGINCETETAQAFELAGFEAKTRHINDLISEKYTLDQLSQEFAAVAIPGGFSFGDDLASGRVLALKLRYGLEWDFKLYAQRGGLVIGICNGFQALLRLGIFSKSISITQNEGGKFINTWVRVKQNGDRCVWLKGIGTIDVPMRHGEGRIIIQKDKKSEVFSKLDRQGVTCLKYEINPNGSVDSLAGLCDPSGRIFGLMPHPEAFVRWTAHPEWTTQPTRAGAPGEGLQVFINAYEESKGASG